MYFRVFGLNTERYGVSLCIQSECQKIRTRITPNMDTFHITKLCKISMFYVMSKYVVKVSQKSSKLSQIP